MVYKQSSGTKTSQVGFVVNVGSRDDGNNPGIAHCFEHMLFRGTHKRSSNQIINRIELVGGELNAFTAKDVTVVYANVLSDYFSRSIDLLSDIVFDSNFTKAALSKERNIIKEEINLYLDTPEEYLYDEFQTFMYPGHPMGYNILGTEDTLAKIGIEELNTFYKAYYQPKNMVLSVISDLPFEKVVSLCQWVENYKGEPVEKRAVNVALPKYGHFDKIIKKEFNLAYVCLGTEAYNHLDAKKYNLMLLNNILGGPGMNSKLNMSIREKRALTYQIDSTYTSYDNTGMFYINFATEINQLELTLVLIKAEIDKLCNKEISENALIKAKQQFTNQLRMAEESKSSLMVYNGKQLLLYNRVNELDYYLKMVNAVDAEMVKDTAEEIISYGSLSQLKLIPD